MDNPDRRTRKVKFTPKKPPLRKDKAVHTTSDVNEADDEIPEFIKRRAQKSLGRERARPEPTPKQVAFEHVPTTHLRTFGKRRQGAGSSAGEVLKDPGLDNEQNLLSLPNSAKTDDISESFEMSVNELPLKKKEYKDPWDYEKDNYPMTLPLRRPNSGNPEHLDAEDFGGNEVYDENSINVAAALGLVVESNDPQMIYFQCPDIFPRPKTSSAKGCSSKELPKGHTGKMLVYKSGKVKLKLGNILYDVEQGVPRNFSENTVAVDADSKQFSVLGDLPYHGVVTPDVISMLEDLPNP